MRKNPTLTPRWTLLLLLVSVSGSDHDLGSNQRFVCTPLPADAPCLSGGHRGERGTSWGVPEEAQATILHLRESLVQQKETILDQRETIRELNAKLALCQGFGLGAHGHDEEEEEEEVEHEHAHYGQHRRMKPTHEKHTGADLMSPSPSSSPEQMIQMLSTLKERLEHLQTHNTSTAYSASLKELLQRKISALEQQMLRYAASITDGNHRHGDDNDDDEDEDDESEEREGHNIDEEHRDNLHDVLDYGVDNRHHGDPHHDDGHRGDNEATGHGSPRTSYLTQERRTSHNKLDKVLNQLTHTRSDTGQRKRNKSSGGFQIGFPMRTNYMYGRVKRTLTREIYAMTLCMWLKGGASSIGTPISYSVPGQANELVLIEWGGNPMELLVKDMAVPLTLSLHDGKWHHVCVTWSARDGIWEVYQDGAKKGSGENLNAWQPIKPGGVFILGQEQDSLGGRFDATQAFVGEISDLQLWSRVLKHHDIYSLASCRGHMTGDVISWAESVLELHGGVTKYPFDPCH